jgi:hypothetical protein
MSLQTSLNQKEFTDNLGYEDFLSVVLNSMDITLAPLHLAGQEPVVFLNKIRLTTFSNMIKAEHINGWESRILNYDNSVCYTVLWNTYIEHMAISPESKAHYWCNTCAKFIGKLGSLVYIDNAGNTKSILWSSAVEALVPDFFKPLVAKLRAVVESENQVDSRLCFDDIPEVLGRPMLGEFNHLAVNLPDFITALKNRDTTTTAVGTINSELAAAAQFMKFWGIYTSESFTTRVKHIKTFLNNDPKVNEYTAITQTIQPMLVRMETLLDSLKQIKATNQNNFRNAVILHAYYNPDLIAYHNTSLGSLLLIDFNEGVKPQVSTEEWYEYAIPSLLERADPLKYRRFLADASKQQLAAAIEKLATDGYANSLLQRTAILDDVPENVWLLKNPTLIEPVVENKPDVLSEMQALLEEKSETKSVDLWGGPVIDLGQITISYFSNKLLSELVEITTLKDTRSLLTGNNLNHVKSDSLTILLTYLSDDAKPIWKWDKPEDRFPLIPVCYVGGMYHKDFFKTAEILGVVEVDIDDGQTSINKKQLLAKFSNVNPDLFKIGCLYNPYYIVKDLEPHGRAITEYIKDKDVAVGTDVYALLNIGGIALKARKQDGTIVKFNINTTVLN